ncbi:MAG: hypothetical protein QW303_06395 [Nitrososphaerota archaeon]
MLPKKHKLTGFSLIELLLTLGLIIIGITVFLSLTDIFSRIRSYRTLTKAYHTASEKIEELRNLPFNSLPDSGTFTSNGFTGELVIADYNGNEIKKVTVTVNYYDNSTPKQAKLETLISKYGLNQ